MARILVLQGSPRPAGNTQAVLEPMMEAAKAAGAEVEHIQISKLGPITGCMECYACQGTPDEPACVIDDGLRAVVAKAFESDVIVWATPVFCWSVAWPLKMAMDRFFCTLKYKAGGEPQSILAGRRMAVVVTAAGGEQDGADLVLDTCRRFTDYTGNAWAGALVAAELSTPDAVRKDERLMERARAFGKTLAKE